jgi:ABC-2 type transport system permease protein
MTTPVRDLEVVLAKFTGAMLFYILMWLPLLACLYTVTRYSNDATTLDSGIIASTYLGITLLGTVYVAIGCFASALTRSQIIAAVISFAGGISLFLLSFLSRAFASGTGWHAEAFGYLGMIEHMQDFARGVVDTRAVTLYLSLTAVFLFLTYKAIESRRWK